MLSANLLSGADSSNGQSRWRLSKNFVFSILENAVGSDTAELGRELRRIKRLYAQLRPPGRRPNVRLRAIPAVALEELNEVFRPDSVRNPFRTDALKWRNFVIHLVLTQLGLRKGEALSLSLFTRLQAGLRRRRPPTPIHSAGGGVFNVAHRVRPTPAPVRVRRFRY